MNPPIAAAAKPNTISCTCQATGSSALARPIRPDSAASQIATAIAAHAAAAKKNGRNP